MKRKTRRPAAKTMQCSLSPYPVPTLHIGCRASDHYSDCNEYPNVVPLGRMFRSAGLIAEVPQPADFVNVLVILALHQPNASTMSTMSTIQIVEDVIHQSDPMCSTV